MASRKSAAKKAVAAENEPVVPTPTAASREADKQETAPVFRVDLGQGLPTPPIRTATDHHK